MHESRFPATGDDALGTRALYRLLTSVIVPRPIVWVTTRSADGVDNLAPHSFSTVACVDPPIVQFTSVGVKDTLRNVRETRDARGPLARIRDLAPLSRLGGDEWGTVGEVVERRRVPWREVR